VCVFCIVSFRGEATHRAKSTLSPIIYYYTSCAYLRVTFNEKSHLLWFIFAFFSTHKMCNNNDIAYQTKKGTSKQNPHRVAHIIIIMILIIITWVYNNVTSKIILYVFYVIIIHWPLSTMCSEELEGYVRVLSRSYRRHTHRVCFNDWKKILHWKSYPGLLLRMRITCSEHSYVRAVRAVHTL